MARDTQGTRDRLFEAAVALIGERGYTGTTVDEIVERAGVAKGTVYYHFKSKAELFAALLDDGLERLATSFRAATVDTPNATAALRALVHAELTYIQQYQAFSKLVMSEMWRLDRDWRDAIGKLRVHYGSVLAATIERGIQCGEFRADLDVQLTASALFGIVVTAALDWLVFDRERKLADVEGQLIAMVLAAVKA
ncbi:MAG: TetR/AcrR family transcriptional regulator [Thermoleophilia bacterium]